MSLLITQLSVIASYMAMFFIHGWLHICCLYLLPLSAVINAIPTDTIQQLQLAS